MGGGGGGALITFSFQRIENGLVIPMHLPRTKIKRRDNTHKELCKGAGWEVCSTRTSWWDGVFWTYTKRLVV